MGLSSDEKANQFYEKRKKKEKKKRKKKKEKWKERENSLHYVVRLPCTAGQQQLHNLRQLNAQQI